MSWRPATGDARAMQRRNVASGTRGRESRACPRLPFRAAVPALSTSRVRQSGYTLLEVIIAFGLLAAALALLLGTLTGATRQVRRAADSGTAALHAQSILDQVGVGEPLKAGADAGDFGDGRYRWTLQVRPWTEPGPPLPTAIVSGTRLFEVVLDVEWGEAADQRLRLQTLRLVETPAGASL